MDITEKEVNEGENDYPYGLLRESEGESDHIGNFLDTIKQKKMESLANENNNSDAAAIRSLLFQHTSWEDTLKNFGVNNQRLGNKSDIFPKFYRDNDRMNSIYNMDKKHFSLRGSNSTRVEKRTALKRFINDDIINLVHVNESARNDKLEYAGRQKKKSRNLDTYAESLLYANKIFNKAYGLERRKVPAHMPHLLDKTIIEEMQKKFAGEFDKTSSHRVRNSEDMQFAFSYFYFLLSEKRSVSAAEIFDAFDTDKSR